MKFVFARKKSCDSIRNNKSEPFLFRDELCTKRVICSEIRHVSGIQLLGCHHRKLWINLELHSQPLACKLQTIHTVHFEVFGSSVTAKFERNPIEDTKVTKIQLSSRNNVHFSLVQVTEAVQLLASLTQPSLTRPFNMGFLILPLCLGFQSVRDHTEAKLCFATLVPTQYQWTTNRLHMIDFWSDHDTTITTDNKCTETQLILVHLCTSKKRYNNSFAWYFK